MNTETDTAPGRTPGKYLVWGLGALGVLLFAFVLVLAVRLTPAAERWRGDAPAPTERR